MKLFKTFIFSLLLLGSVQIQAQEWRLVMDLLVTDDGRKMQGAQIQLITNGNVVKTFTTDSKGEVEVPVPPNGLYLLSVSGPGYINKKLEIDTRNVNPEDVGNEDIPYRADVDIFKKMDDINLKILDDPIGKIWYDDEYGEFTYDKDYTLKKQSALHKLKEDLEARKKEEAKKQAENRKLADEAIKKGDKAFKAEDWEEAKKQYEIAQGLDPANTYPSFQLGELATKIIKKNENNDKYDVVIKAADNALAANDYKEALAKYKAAIGYKPNDEYATKKIEEVQSLAINAAKVEQNYMSAIEKGDNALMANDMETAKTAFTEAKKLKPSESYPTTKLEEINSLLARQNQKEEKYKEAIQKGDEAIASADYNLAKTAYSSALEFKPNEQYPKDQIAKTEKLLAEAAKKEQDYLAAISKGDNALDANNFEEAKQSFANASSLKPNESYPKNKIKEIENMLAANAEKEQEYKQNIKLADDALAQQQYENAKKNYQAALKIQPNESYPQTKITEIDEIIAENAKKDQNFQLAINKGDQELTAKNYTAAKTAFEEALAIKPNEEYPKTKISEIQSIEEELANKEENYKKAIQSADEALAAENWENAKNLYNEALSLKPKEKYPQDKISDINDKLAEQQQLEQEYKLAIENADEALASNDYTTALTEYKKAQGFKSNETYPAQKIKEINSLLAAEEEKEENYKAAVAAGDEAITSKNFTEAKKQYGAALEIKPDEQYPQDKLDEVNELIAQNIQVEENYKSAIATADEAFENEEFEKAKESYNKALSIKSNESYPSQKIEEIDQKMAALVAKEEEERLEKERIAKIEADYQTAIEKAEQLLEKEKLDESIIAFENAQSIKPEEQYPQQKLQEIQNLKEAQRQNLQQAELEESYQKAISEGDQALAIEDYANARRAYNEAKNIKKEESYPKEKLAEIEKIERESALAEENAAKAKAEAELNTKYEAAVASADTKFNDADYDSAKKLYQDALAIKPEENYPQDKINEINKQLSSMEEQQEAERLAKEKAAKLETEYLAAISIADQELNSENYEKAKVKYSEALNLKPNESYPQQKIEEIDAYFEQQANKDAERAAALAAEKEKINNEYNSLIATADKKAADEQYKQAIADYQAAAKVKPSESYPRSKIDELNELLINMAASEEEKKLQEELKAKNEMAYQEAVANADKNYAEENWDEAITAYEQALELKNNETYPRERIVRIQQIKDEARERSMAAEEKQKEVEKELLYNTLIRNADEAFKNKSYSSAKRDYEEAISLEMNKTYPIQQLEEIERILEEEKQQLAKAEEEQNEIIEEIKEEEEEPIIVQHVPKSTIEGDTEEKIDQIYEEIWAKNKEEKEKFLSTKSDEVTENSERLRELDEKNKKNALERLEEISVSHNKSISRSSQLNSQNYESVQNNSQIQADFNERMEVTNKRRREAKLSEQQYLREGIQKQNKDREENNKSQEKFEQQKQQYENSQNRYRSQQELSQSTQLDKIKEQQDYQHEKETAQTRAIEEKSEILAQRKAELERIEKERRIASEERIANKASKAESETNTMHEVYASNQQDFQDNSMQRINAHQEYLKNIEAKQNSIIKEKANDLTSRKEELSKMEQQRRKASERRISESSNQDFTEMNQRFSTRQEQAQQRELSKIEDLKSRTFNTNQPEVIQQKASDLTNRKEEIQKAEESRSKASEKRIAESAEVEYYQGAPKLRKDENASKYPQGVSEEVIEGDTYTTIRRIVVNNTQMDVYEKVLHNWGGVFYTKNGVNITEVTWDSETR